MRPAARRRSGGREPNAPANEFLYETAAAPHSTNLEREAEAELPPARWIRRVSAERRRAIRGRCRVAAFRPSAEEPADQEWRGSASQNRGARRPGRALAGRPRILFFR